ncbi:hypothetical protein [Halomicrobium zhouii]|uniref:hypothetical protein n=1 Tax=Halomicrobium zhouii TaxID=767519 RepID=UPI0011609519|nr:hypothetical protein [Halomicrobium zhouii]
MPRDRLDAGGWVQSGKTVETVFELPGVSVRGATLQYRDDATSTAIAETAAVEATWRFFFATALSFEPEVPPTASRAFLLPVVRARATDRFRSTLQESGLTDVERVRTERRRIGYEKRVPLSRFEAALELETPAVTVPLGGWLGVWYDDGFLVSGGAYPERPIGAVLGLDDPPPVLQRDVVTYRRELLELMRDVS